MRDVISITHVLTKWKGEFHMAKRDCILRQLPLPIEGEIAQISLTKGYLAIIDAIDADLSQFKWCAAPDKHGNIYVVRVEYRDGWRGKQTAVRLHREILSRKLDRPLTNKELVDHINHDCLDNRRANLRLATPAQNVQNRKKPKNNTTGYKGVTYIRGVYQASIEANGVATYLGRRKTAEEAYELYKAAVIQLHGDFGSID